MKRVHLQALPAPLNHDMAAGALSVARKKPTQELMDAYIEEERMDALDIMQESLVYGFADALDQPYPLTLADQYPDSYSPAPGRCIWTWETVRKVKGDMPFDSGYLQTLALRASQHMPKHLQRVSPRFAWVMTGMKLKEFHRCMAALQEELGDDLPSDYEKLYRMISSIPYEGRPRTFDRPRHYLRMQVPKAPGNSRRNSIQEFAVKVPHVGRGGVVRTDISNRMSLAKVLSLNPPYAADLGPWLDGLCEAAVARAENYLSKLPGNWGESQPDGAPGDIEKVRRFLYEDSVQQAAAQRFVHNKWLDVIGALTDRTSANTKAADLLAYSMMAELVAKRNRHFLRSWRVQDLLPMCRLTGISPAAFVNFAMDHRQRCGYLPIPEGEIRLLAEVVQRINIPASQERVNAHRANLVKELHGLADKAAINGFTDARILRVMEHGDLPEWGIEAEAVDREAMGW